MRVAFFYHSLASDWNHGNAHFLRGVVGELLARGHRVDVYEPADAWSVTQLIADPAATERRGAAARARALRYTRERMTAAYLDLYERLLTEAEPEPRKLEVAR